MADMGAAEPRKYDIGGVLGTGFSLIGRRPVLFLGLAFALALIPVVLQAIMAPGMMTGAVDPETGLPDFNVAVFAVITPVSYVVYALLYATLTSAALQELDGAKPTFGSSLAVGLRKFFPLFILTFLVSLAVMVGFIFLIVPGVILALMLSASGPALVAGDAGILGAFSRSRKLTKGSRWRLLVLYIAVMGIMMMVQIPVSILVLFGNLILIIVAQAVFTSVLNVLLISIITASYVELRDIKDGPNVQELSSIFE